MLWYVCTYIRIYIYMLYVSISKSSKSSESSESSESVYLGRFLGQQRLSLGPATASTAVSRCKPWSDSQRQRMWWSSRSWDRFAKLPSIISSQWEKLPCLRRFYDIPHWCSPILDLAKYTCNYMYTCYTYIYIYIYIIHPYTHIVVHTICSILAGFVPTMFHESQWGAQQLAWIGAVSKVPTCGSPNVTGFVGGFPHFQVVKNQSQLWFPGIFCSFLCVFLCFPESSKHDKHRSKKSTRLLAHWNYQRSPKRRCFNQCPIAGAIKQSGTWMQPTYPHWPDWRRFSGGRSPVRLASGGPTPTRRFPVWCENWMKPWDFPRFQTDVSATKLWKHPKIFKGSRLKHLILNFWNIGRRWKKQSDTIRHDPTQCHADAPSSVSSMQPAHQWPTPEWSFNLFEAKWRPR